MGFRLQIQKLYSIFAPSALLSFLNFRDPFLENLISKSIVKLKNQVMKKFRLLLDDENAQARLVIVGFVMAFALLFIFFF
jgi:hypothetical protein